MDTTAARGSCPPPVPPVDPHHGRRGVTVSERAKPCVRVRDRGGSGCHPGSYVVVQISRKGAGPVQGRTTDPVGPVGGPTGPPHCPDRRRHQRAVLR